MVGITTAVSWNLPLDVLVADEFETETGSVSPNLLAFLGAAGLLYS